MSDDEISTCASHVPCRGKCRTGLSSRVLQLDLRHSFDLNVLNDGPRESVLFDTTDFIVLILDFRPREREGRSGFAFGPRRCHGVIFAGLFLEARTG
jgi:hypothetical protein